MYFQIWFCTSWARGLRSCPECLVVCVPTFRFHRKCLQFSSYPDIPRHLWTTCGEGMHFQAASGETKMWLSVTRDGQSGAPVLAGVLLCQIHPFNQQIPYGQTSLTAGFPRSAQNKKSQTFSFLVFRSCTTSVKRLTWDVRNGPDVFQLTSKQRQDAHMWLQIKTLNCILQSSPHKWWKRECASTPQYVKSMTHTFPSEVACL